MHASNAPTDKSCGCGPRCGPPAVDRLNYFTGQFLAERDFRAEQAYHIGKHRDHNRYLHGSGTVCGLKVVPHPNPDCPDRVVIEPGLAVDCCGREIVVEREVCVDLAKLVTEHQLASGSGVLATAAINVPRGTYIAVSVCYRECAGEQAPALYSECGCGGDSGLHASRVHETFRVKAEPISAEAIADLLKSTRPPPGVLKWASTMNVDGAIRAAVSPDSERLYVITDAPKGVLHVFETANGCLHATRPLTDAQGAAMTAIDVAVSPDGGTVYVLCRPTDAGTGDANYVVLAINAEALNDEPTTLPVAAATPDAGDALAGGSDGSLFVLLPGGGDDKRVFVVRPAAAQATPFATGARKLAAMALSATGRRAFFAVAGAATLTVYDRVADAFADVPLAAAADRVAVSSDETTLLTASAADGVRVYSLDAAGNPALPGTPVAVPDGPITALAVVGRRAYVTAADPDGPHGQIRSIDLTDLSAPAVVSDPVAVVADARQVLLAPDAGHVYVVGHGTADQSCGGVSVLDAADHDCSNILWRQLDGCPPCDKDCVLLAIVRWQPGQAVPGAAIRNEVRPLLPSTNTLRDLILCCCAGHRDTPEPQPTDPGPQPSPLKLTRLVALSWRHNTRINQPLKITGEPPDWVRRAEMTAGLVVGFDGEIAFDVPASNALVETFDSDHVFRVKLRHVMLENKFPHTVKFPFRMWFDLPAGDDEQRWVGVVPVVWSRTDPAGVIDEAHYVNPQTEKPTGLAYLFTPSLLRWLLEPSDEAQSSWPELAVELHGDHVRDAKRIPVDVDFPRFALQAIDDTVQPPRAGGVFQSWLTLQRG